MPLFFVCSSEVKQYANILYPPCMLFLNRITIPKYRWGKTHRFCVCQYISTKKNLLLIVFHLKYTSNYCIQICIKDIVICEHFHELVLFHLLIIQLSILLIVMSIGMSRWKGNDFSFFFFSSNVYTLISTGGKRGLISPAPLWLRAVSTSQIKRLCKQHLQHAPVASVCLLSKLSNLN